MNRTFEDGWYWLCTIYGWKIIQVSGGIIYAIGMTEVKRANDPELNKLTRIKIEPPNLDYNVTSKWS